MPALELYSQKSYCIVPPVYVCEQVSEDAESTQWSDWKMAK